MMASPARIQDGSALASRDEGIPQPHRAKRDGQSHTGQPANVCPRLPSVSLPKQTTILLLDNANKKPFLVHAEGIEIPQRILDVGPIVDLTGVSFS
jgi:hypothetical protein